MLPAPPLAAEDVLLRRLCSSALATQAAPPGFCETSLRALRPPLRPGEAAALSFACFGLGPAPPDESRPPAAALPVEMREPPTEELVDDRFTTAVEVPPPAWAAAAATVAALKAAAAVAVHQQHTCDGVQSRGSSLFLPASACAARHAGVIDRFVTGDDRDGASV